MGLGFIVKTRGCSQVLSEIVYHINSDQSPAANNGGPAYLAAEGSAERRRLGCARRRDAGLQFRGGFAKVGGPRAGGAGEGIGVREVRLHLEQAIQAAVARLAEAARVPPPAGIPWSVSPQAAFGDLSTPLALSFASALGRRPPEVAEEILRALTLDPSLIARAEVAGAGYLNFFVAPSGCFTGKETLGPEGGLGLSTEGIDLADRQGAGNHAREWIISGPGRLGLPGREWVSRRRGRRARRGGGYS